VRWERGKCLGALFEGGDIRGECSVIRGGWVLMGGMRGGGVRG